MICRHVERNHGIKFSVKSEVELSPMYYTVCHCFFLEWIYFYLMNIYNMVTRYTHFSIIDPKKNGFILIVISTSIKIFNMKTNNTF